MARKLEAIWPREHFSAWSQAKEASRPQVFRLNYLLDTNVCIALMNENSPQIEARVMNELRANSQLFVSSVSVFELCYGVEKSSRRDSNVRKLSAFLLNSIIPLPFEGEDARLAGRIRSELEAIGRPLGQYDLLIAGQALRHNMTLVTANAREFGRVRNLSWENWSR